MSFRPPTGTIVVGTGTSLRTNEETIEEEGDEASMSSRVVHLTDLEDALVNATVIDDVVFDAVQVLNGEQIWNKKKRKPKTRIEHIFLKITAKLPYRGINRRVGLVCRLWYVYPA